MHVCWIDLNTFSYWSLLCSSLMRTSRSSMTSPDSFPWQTLDPTPMDHNSLSPLWWPTGKESILYINFYSMKVRWFSASLNIRISKLHTSGMILYSLIYYPFSYLSSIDFCSPCRLDGKHTVFGEVIDGFELLDKIESNPTGAMDRPIKAVVIKDSGELWIHSDEHL